MTNDNDNGESKVVALGEYKEKLQEKVAEMSKETDESAATWTPRQALEFLLTEMDEGRFDPEQMVVLYTHAIPTGGSAINFHASQVNRNDFLALLTHMKHIIINDWFS